MRTKILLFLIFLITIGLLTVREAPARAQALDCPGDYLPGSLLVGWRPGASHPLASIADDLPLQQQELAPLPVSRLQVPEGQECRYLQVLRADPSVLFAELDYLAHADLAPSSFVGSNPGETFFEGLDQAQTADIPPNDPDLERQWYLEQIQAEQAWQQTTGSADILIAVIDSGIQIEHPDLQGKIWTNPGEIAGNHLDDDGNGYVNDVHGWHFYQSWNGDTYIPAQDNQVADDFGHGTHITGILAATADNGIGITGLSWRSQVLPIKVLDANGVGAYSDIALGIRYAVDNGADIINLSLGGTEPSETLKDAVDYALKKGVLVVAAAGNTGKDLLYPAALPQVIAVGASDSQDNRASFSNTGPELDLVAPGTYIYSTWYRGNYFSKSGTSMAAPLVAGVASLVWARWPALDATEVAAKILQSADDVGEPGFDPATGWGRLNANRAVLRREEAADLWLQMLVKGSSPTEGGSLEFTFGNQGMVRAQDVHLQISAQQGAETLPLYDLAIGTLPPSDGACCFYTYPLPALLPSGELTIRATLTGTTAEYNIRDNLASANVTQPYWQVLPLAHK